MTLEEKIRKEAQALAECMTEESITTEYGPLSELTSLQRAFGEQRHQGRAHGAFDRLTELFARWRAKHPR